jgi:hypothetical protein
VSKICHFALYLATVVNNLNDYQARRMKALTTISETWLANYPKSVNDYTPGYS